MPRSESTSLVIDWSTLLVYHRATSHDLNLGLYLNWGFLALSSNALDGIFMP